MLTTASDLDAFLSRLTTVPAAVQAALEPAVATALRAYGSGEAKATAIDAYARRVRDRRLSPDRDARLGHRQPTASDGGVDLDAVKQRAVKSALQALGRA